MFLRVKVEKKIRHYTLSSREWINVLYVIPSRKDPPLTREATILSMRAAGDWTDRDGSDLEAGIVTEECWVSGVKVVPTSLRVVGTRSPTAIVRQWGLVRTGPIGPSWAPMATELVVGIRIPTVPSSSLTEHLLPWLIDLEQWTQIVEVCDYTSLQFR